MKSKKRRPKGMLPKKLPMYLNGGMMGGEQPIEGLDVRDLIQYLNEYDMGEGSEIPTYGGDPDMITNQQRALSDEEETMARLSLGITPPEMSEDILRAGDSPFRTITQEKDRIAEQRATEAAPEMAFEAARMSPGGGELIDAAEFMKVAMTGEDFYGEEQDPALFGGMTAAGYLIPNILEKPMKSAWRAIKKFPSKMPKQEFRKLPDEQREAVLQNLTQAHNEVYDMSPDMSDLDQDVFNLSGGSYNVRQLSSLMSGSKLENTVGKDGLIQVSQIENLINSKDLSVVEREALQEVMGTEAFQTLREMGGGSKVDYNKFRNLTSGQISVHNNIYVDTDDDLAALGLDKLGYQDLDRYTRSDLEAMRGRAQVKVLKHNLTDLMSKEYGHYGRDVIGHYRTFDLPDEPGVLYISEVQADPLQARGPAGQKTVGLDVSKPVDVDAQLETARIQLEAAEKHLAEVRAGAPYNPQKVYGAEGLPTGRGSLDDPRGISAINKAQALGVDDIRVLMENRDAEPWMKLEEKQLISFMDEHKRYIKALEGGYRGGPNAKQANLIKNQDQFLISHILENEAKGADKLRFPTGKTTSKIQGYGDQTQRISRAKSDVSLYENISKEARENELVDKTFKEHPMFKGKDEDEIIYLMEGFAKAASDPRIPTPGGAVAKIRDEFAQGFRNLGGNENTTRKAVFDWYDATKRMRSSREHLSRINASEQATQGIMKGYDRLPKALKKHGLDATKVTDDAGNIWWEVDIPARLGEGVGEIRAYKRGGKFRILKK